MDHDHLHDQCGVGDCTTPVTPGSRACENPSHERWYQAYLKRFGRLSFGKVTRIIRRTAAAQEPAVAGDGTGVTPQHNVPAIHPLLPDGPNGEPGAEVIHRFKAGNTYCVQTVQWACGVPVGWGKCYRSESPSQVLSILNRIFPPNQPEDRPSFLFYDNACTLLSHILAQDPNTAWLNTTRFLVDSWHYITHRTTDQLCKTWCNPAPADGSQPDLVIVRMDEAGRPHTIRAYNTETAEQLNAWLNAFEGPLRQMTDYNFDFFIHVLLYLYKEMVEERMKRQAADAELEADADD